MDSFQQKKNWRSSCYRNIMDETSPGAHHSGESNGSHFQKNLPFVTMEIIKIQITEVDDNVSLVF